MTLPRLAPLLVLLASAAIVGSAQLFQHIGGLAPCELCLYERWPYYAAIVLSLVALAVAGRGGLVAALIALCGLLFLGDVVLGAYHVGVEHHWIPGPTACTGTPTRATSVEELKAQIMGQQAVRCDVVQWSMFGVSLAGLNLLASLVLAVFCFVAAPRLRHGSST